MIFFNWKNRRCINFFCCNIYVQKSCWWFNFKFEAFIYIFTIINIIIIIIIIRIMIIILLIIIIIIISITMIVFIMFIAMYVQYLKKQSYLLLKFFCLQNRFFRCCFVKKFINFKILKVFICVLLFIIIEYYVFNQNFNNRTNYISTITFTFIFTVNF
jgi:hypothetical protein